MSELERMAAKYRTNTKKYYICITFVILYTLLLFLYLFAGSLFFLLRIRTHIYIILQIYNWQYKLSSHKKCVSSKIDCIYIHANETISLCNCVYKIYIQQNNEWTIILFYDRNGGNLLYSLYETIYKDNEIDRRNK